MSHSTVVPAYLQYLSIPICRLGMDLWFGIRMVVLQEELDQSARQFHRVESAREF